MEKVTSQMTHCGGNKLIMSSVILLQSPDHAPELSLHLTVGQTDSQRT